MSHDRGDHLPLSFRSRYAGVSGSGTQAQPFAEADAPSSVVLLCEQRAGAPLSSNTLGVRVVNLMMIRLRVVALVAAVLSGSAVVRAADVELQSARIGFVSPQTISTVPTVAALWQRLRELGWRQGENLNVELSSAEGNIERLPELMNEMVARKLDVLITVGTPAALAARKATSTLPIVVAGMGDPLGTGLAASLARPGGNLTGLSLEMTEDLSGKWLELLQEAVPKLSTVAVVSNPESPLIRKVAGDLQRIGAGRGVKLRFADVRDAAGLDGAFKQASRGAQAVLVLPDPLTMNHVREITALAAAYRLPAIYPFLDFMDAGGLMAYSVDAAAVFRRAAEYVDKILRGAKPAELPIEQPTQFKLVVNLRTAKALGVTMPEAILVRADDVIR
jgi:putative ABC transport system substrate-binding protein